MKGATFYVGDYPSASKAEFLTAIDDSQPSPASVAGMEDLRRLGFVESQQWRVTGAFPLMRSVPCRKAIVTLVRHAAAGEGVVPYLSREDRDWLLDNLRLLQTALREVLESRRIRRRYPHVRNSQGHLRLRAQVVADAFWDAANFHFDAKALAAYLDGWQQNQTLEMSELWILRCALQLSILEQIANALSSVLVVTSPAAHPGVSQLISALHDIGESDWDCLFEDISVVEQILRRDPADVYERMTKESRAVYRATVAELARHSFLDEWQVAERARSLAAETILEQGTNPALQEKRSHIGYYLVDAGASSLRSAIAYRPDLAQSLQFLLRKFASGFYLIGIEILTLLIVILVLAGLPHYSPIVAGFFLLLIPASQAAVELINTIVTSLLPAQTLPKLDFSAGIPDAHKTMVAVPALLFNELEVEHLLNGLEIRYLANRGPNLYFALLTDSPDSPQPCDDKEALAESCARGIRELNRKYGASDKGPFFLFHRQRTFNPSQNTWMGWERKRGKLLDLCRMLSGDQERFSLKVGNLSVLPEIRFVITLDADTQLPRDAAQRLVGTLAHPLNRAVIDPATNIVTAGYGILQPRVGISVQSASRSWLASIYSGQTGFDIYTRAVSDVYQDLYGEGIFAGKGIFDVAVFEQVLNGRFPCNTLLSHDLIEGAYARAALVSDIEVIEDYPSHFSAYSRRKHRWVRGDWQTSQWLFPRVPDDRGRPVPNPISLVSRWKIFDNLRRSLVDPCLLALLLAGWFFLPGRPWYWTAITVSLLVLPAYAHMLLALLRTRDVRQLPASTASAGADLARGHLNVLVTLTFLPHQALVMIDAIVRTIIRHRITGRRLLEWETAAEAESGKARRPADTYLALTPWIALGLAVALALVRPQACGYALPFLLVWAGAPSIARWLSREKVAPRVMITPVQKRFLRTSALHIWRYFQENSGPGENWLIPDNVQESAGKAHRISPTNLGLLLNARLAACDIGCLTLAEFIASSEGTMAAMAMLPRHRGHFFNWYDTLTLQPLSPPLVSTVDSGNLAASLWTFKHGCLALAKKPILGEALWQGLQDHVRILRELDRVRARPLHLLTQNWGTDGWKWLTGLEAAAQAAQELSAVPAEPLRQWAAAFLERVSEVRALVETLVPWLSSIGEQAVRDLVGEPWTALAELTLDRVSVLADQFRGRLRSPQFDPLNEAMLRAAVAAENLESALLRLAADAGRIADEMDFRFLYDERKKLLSVGYDVANRRLEGARYGLLASEARTAAFVAVAKGDIPRDAWIHLGRAQTRCGGRRILLSWTGTMFEYLMPTLWMRHYPRTILEQSSRAAVDIQRAYGRRMRFLWGVSESAYSVTDADGFYQYRAFGLPSLALKRARTQPRVIAPYAAFLALAVHPIAAIHNLQRIRKRGWWGRYGLYEAVEFNEQDEPAAVRSWMAHHHAMSLMAITNCLCESQFQRLFHSEPQVIATELLLHEKVPVGFQVRQEPHCEPPVRLVTSQDAASQAV